jgi:hypothetical protein
MSRDFRFGHPDACSVVELAPRRNGVPPSLPGPTACIWLTAEAQGDEVLISVKDTGIGIATEMQEGIFDMFTQIKHPVNHGTAGLGIGLAKSLVQMHAGSIEVHSEGGGKGSEFRVRLPVLAEVLTEERQQVDTDYLHLLSFAMTRYDVVVVDLPEVVNDATEAIVRQAQSIYLLSTPEMGCCP